MITNTNPVRACLADFGFSAIVHDPNLGTEAGECEASIGTPPFMAPELVFPSRFGFGKRTPTEAADVYGMAMVALQVLTTRYLAHMHIDSSCVGAHWNTAVW